MGLKEIIEEEQISTDKTESNNDLNVDIKTCYKKTWNKMLLFYFKVTDMHKESTSEAETFTVV